MSVNLHKNIFYLFFIITVNFIFISSYTEEFPFYQDIQREIVDSVCNNNTIFCPMFSAIEDIFSSIQNEEIRIFNDLYDYLLVEYNNIYARDMICDENLDFFEQDDKFEIKFNNCNVLIEGKIGYRNPDISSVDFDTFLSELKFNSISFYVTKSSFGEMKVEFIENPKKYNYNRKDAIFSSQIVNLTYQMNDLMDKVFDGFKKKINDTISINNINSTILSEALNHFQHQFTFFNGPGIMEETKNITYIFYSKFDFDSFVHINHKYFFSWMNVTFEYALNHNISYNVGYFIIDNFVFEENTENKNIYNGYGNKIATRYPEFNNDNNDDIWKTIINDFKDNLNSKDKYNFKLLIIK